VDGDDEVYQAENLRNLVANAQPDVGAIWFPYHYALDEFGNLTTLYERERLLRAKFGWVWQGRLHETVSPLTECKYVRTNDVIVLHKHLSGAPRSERNFKLLNIMLKENPSDKRIWLYLGHQNFAAQNWTEAAEWYLKFGSDTGAIPLERYQALCYCSRTFRNLKDKQAIDVALMAIELFPSYKDAYLEIAHSYLLFGDVEKALQFARLSEVKEIMQEPPHLIFINPLEYTFNMYALYSECYTKKGDMKTAFEYLAKAFEIRPTEDISRNLAYVRELDMRTKISDSIKTLTVHLLNNKELVKLNSLLKSVPYWFRDLPDYLELEAGIKHYSSLIKDKPETLEGSDESITVNIAFSVDPESLLDELDKIYKRVTIVCPIPSPESKQINAYSQRDMEDLVVSREGRHILNLQREPSRIICEYANEELTGLKIRFFVGQGIEYWNPKTIKEVGCGGSETAVAETARHLASWGNYPIIHAMDTQVWDGVVYRHFSNFNPDSTACHLFISSRNPSVFYYTIPSKQKWLYVHDIHCFDRFTPEVCNQLDAIVCLSQWHANFFKRSYPFLNDAEVIDMDGNKLTYDDLWTPHVYYEGAQAFKLPKLAIIGNGINTERFKDITETRVPFRFIWCSSPDRGLERVLNLWPLIKKELPDAELKIFYGWEYFDSSLWIPQQGELKRRLLQLIKQEGVQWCGRIGQDELAHELMKADAMLYPPPHDFRETYGIAFLEAQAAGVICLYRMNGALGETIGNRGVPLQEDLTDEEIVSKISSNLNDRARCDILRDKGRKYALKRDWSVQADKFLKLYDMLN